jgi:hypothetical protein
MKEFLKFESVGGSASADVKTAGTYYIPLDNILICETGGNGVRLWQCDGPGQLGVVRYYEFETTEDPTDLVIALNQLLAANPGGKSIELQITSPANQSIIGWSFTGVAII